MPQEITIDAHSRLRPATAAGTAFVAMLLGHVVVDAFAALLPSSLSLLKVRLDLTSAQSAWLLGLGSLSSGLAQPLCALVSDRLGTRTFGVFGIVLGAVGIGLMGMANSFVSLSVIFALGMIGIGMFHPVGAATIGSLRQHRRTSAVSMFFVAGMAGGVMGAFAWPRMLAAAHGFEWLPAAIIPAVLLAWFSYRAVAPLAPLHEPSHESAAEANSTVVPLSDWKMIAVLYVAAVLRFCVQVTLVYLFVQWVEWQIAGANAQWSREQVAAASAPLVGNLNAAMFVGMAGGGLLAGALIRPGREKWPLVLVPILFTPLMALFPHLPLEAGYLLAALSGMGFASMTPVSIGLAQHFLPRHANMASGLMMGGAWAVAMVGPRCAEHFIGQYGLTATFYLTAATLALSGIVCLGVTGANDE